MPAVLSPAPSETTVRSFLTALTFQHGSPADTGRTLRALIEAGLGELPLPGAGNTLERWRILAAVAGFDLALVKLFEGHTDALAILAELGSTLAQPGEIWAVWAAEPPNARLEAKTGGTAARIRLHGTKAWCSGASCATHALVSAWNEHGDAILAAVDLRRPGVQVTNTGWVAVGMSASASVDVHFENAEAVQIGKPRAYLERPGFWQGGGGIAACWFGATAQIAEFVRTETARRADPYRLAHLGAIDTALAGVASLMREAAALFDRDPRANAMLPAFRVRLAAERAATTVIDRAGRALGAAPLCRNARFAHLMADLPVYIRQSHAERDEAALAECFVNLERSPWEL
jgi:alkylation response protein AidB-like acyl-CoA dehydrogenase